MKKICIALLICIFTLSLTACGGGVAPTIGIEIPDIVDTDETTAKNVLSSNGLIPSVKYEYSDDIAEGNVIRTEPEIGTMASKNTKVTIYISEGPSYMKSSDSRVEWYHLSKKDGEDDWSFYSPYIQDGVLYIECHTVTFGCAMKWKDEYNKGEIIGVASITDSFDKTIPVSAKYEKQSWRANEPQSFTLEIPLGDLDVSKPTDMYLKLYTVDDGNVMVNFFMTW